jgi:hypothetical protein
MESSDIQSAVARTQQAGRIQQQAAEQEEMRRKRFELERSRELADSSKKIQEARESAERRAIEDKWDGPGSGAQKDGRGESEKAPESRGEKPDDAHSSDGTPGSQGGIDVRV